MTNDYNIKGGQGRDDREVTRQGELLTTVIGWLLVFGLTVLALWLASK